MGGWNWGGLGGQGSEVKKSEGLRLGGVREQGLGRKRVRLGHGMGGGRKVKAEVGVKMEAR